jgi:hypothetical protein
MEAVGWLDWQFAWLRAVAIGDWLRLHRESWEQLWTVVSEISSFNVAEQKLYL